MFLCFLMFNAVNFLLVCVNKDRTRQGAGFCYRVQNNVDPCLITKKVNYYNLVSSKSETNPKLSITE